MLERSIFSTDLIWNEFSVFYDTKIAIRREWNTVHDWA